MSLEWKSSRIWTYRALGVAVAIGIMEMLAGFVDQPLTRVPFVTSIVLVMAIPESDAAKPRSIIAGHLISTGCGMICFWILGSGETSSAVAVGAATFLMIASGAVHPPAGIDAFLVPANGLPTSWLLNLVLPGSLLLAAFARLWRLGERSLEGGRKHEFLSARQQKSPAAFFRVLGPFSKPEPPIYARFETSSFRRQAAFV